MPPFPVGQTSFRREDEGQKGQRPSRERKQVSSSGTASSSMNVPRDKPSQKGVLQGGFEQGERREEEPDASQN